MNNQTHLPALAVDLDGTLVKTDFLYESFLAFVKQNPFNIFLVLFWLLSTNRAVMKSRIAARVDLDVANFPYHTEVITWLREQDKSGRKLILATASNEKYAQAVADYLGFFDDVIATHGKDNIKGENKEKKLIEMFGVRGYDYVGDSHADISVWRSARAAIVVSSSTRLLSKVTAIASVDKHFEPTQTKTGLLRAMRPHQWVKNLLIFVPLFTSHSFGSLPIWTAAMLAFVSFSLCASGIYILNDFLDLQADRIHQNKRFRPFASGQVGIPLGSALMITLIALSLFIAHSISRSFLLVILVYLSLTISYSFYLKRLLMADIVVLAGLYTLRIYAGAVAINVSLSFWLLAFSMFLFLSLAIVKRYTELLLVRNIDPSGKTFARAYHINDMPIMGALGSASGFIAVLVMALYLNSDDMLKLYEHPEILWLVCPAMLYWICRIWLLAQRGEVHDDPIVFVIRDSVSRLIGLFVFLLFLFAA